MLATAERVTQQQKRPKATTKRAAKAGARRLDGPMTASLTAHAREFGTSRDRLALLLHRTNAVPIDNGSGHVHYRVRDVHRALLSGSDIETLSPFERKAHWEAVAAENRAREHARSLIPADEFEQELGRVIRLFVHHVETLPDRLERDAGLSGAVVELVERHLDAMRIELAEALAARADAPDAPADQAGEARA